MTSHCANPECATPLRYLRDGRIFQFEIRPGLVKATDDKQVSVAEKVRRVSHFWLCGRCATNLTLSFDAIKGVVLRPRVEAVTKLSVSNQLIDRVTSSPSAPAVNE
jgi:hypothetical protein